MRLTKAEVQYEVYFDDLGTAFSSFLNASAKFSGNVFLLNFGNVAICEIVKLISC